MSFRDNKQTHILSMKIKSVLTGVMFLLLPCGVHAWTGDTWDTITRATIKSLADQMIDSTWTPNNTFNNYEYTDDYGVVVRYTYTKGVNYTGIPYGQAPIQDNWQEFSGYMPITSGGNKSYGNDCSGFVSICWKLPARKTTYDFENGINGTYWSSLGNIGSAASGTLLQGDALVYHSSSGGHILMFLNEESSGFRSMEQNTPPHHATRLLRSYSSVGAYRPIRRNQITGDVDDGAVSASVQNQLTGMKFGNGAFRFVLNGSVGSNYVIQVSSNLVNWLPLSTNTIPADGSVNITNSGIFNLPRQFYRALGR
jgi:hypothetical protein